MKSHFIFQYSGNKRNEVADVVKELDFNNITTIIEPFCGSSAFSFYVSTLYPRRFKYILNDNSPELIELYHIMKDPKKLIQLIEELTEYARDLTPEKYKAIKKEKTLNSWIFWNSLYGFRPGVYPLNIKKDFTKMLTVPILEFLRNEDVSICKGDGLEVYKTYSKDPTAMLFVDPPYISSYNAFYSNPDINVYEYLFKNCIDKEPAKIILVLENIWIIQLFFKDKGTQTIKDKKYELSKKKTTHVTIINKNT
jgi:site-specific DNA-adenine methylase